MAACSSEEIRKEPKPDEEPYEGETVPVEIPLQTRAVNDGNPENVITNARLIVIKGTKITNNKPFTISTHNYTNDSVHVYDLIPVGAIELFLIVNEKTEWNLASLTIGTTCLPNDFERRILSHASMPIVDATHPIPMYRQYRNLIVSPTSQLSINGTPVTDMGVVERLYAKVTLRLSSIFAELANGGEPIQLDSMSIRSIPKYSYFGPRHLYQENANTNYFDSPRTHRTAAYEVDNAHFLDTIVYYVPEHNVFYPAHATYLAVKVSLKDNTDVDQQVEYKIVVGDGITTCTNDSMLNGMQGGVLPLTNLFITRNTHYHFTAKIVSFDIRGEQEIEIRPQILAWNEVALPVEFNDYIFQVSQNEFSLASGTAVNGIILNVLTDHPNGWTATTTNPTRIPLVISSGTGVQGAGDCLKFNYNGAAITNPAADTIKVQVGKVTKHIVVKNL
jgi:hypothetical protein